MLPGEEEGSDTLTHSRLSAEILNSKLRRIRHVALDMDGTIYLGDRLFPESKPFMATLQSLGITFTFLTNNSSKSADEYVTHLHQFGIMADRCDCFTSTHATIELIRRDYPVVAEIYLVGTSGLRREFEQAHFRVLAPDAGTTPDAVVVGFDTHLSYRTLCKAAYWISKGLPYFATHPDLTCPTNLEMLLLDCGAICAAIEAATGRRPDSIGGKPQPAMLQTLAHRLQLQTDEIAMIGDRLYTDVLMAKNAGAFGVLTLTGETQWSQMEDADVHPDLVIENLTELSALLETAHQKMGAAEVD